jgi:uncharacterized RDD family membrane protein YckC
MKILKLLLFNYLTNRYLKSDYWFLRLNKRIKAIVLEMWYTLSVVLPFILILAIPTLFVQDLRTTTFQLIGLLRSLPFSLILIALANKDFFGGQSVVNRLLGYQVVDRKTMRPATKVQCMLRNVTAPLWPIEGVFALAYPKRRLGDFIAGTMLVEVATSDPELILQEIRNVKFDRQTQLALLLSLLWVVTFIIIFDPRLRVW